MAPAMLGVTMLLNMGHRRSVQLGTVAEQGWGTGSADSLLGKQTNILPMNW